MSDSISAAEQAEVDALVTGVLKNISRDSDFGSIKSFAKISQKVIGGTKTPKLGTATVTRADNAIEKAQAASSLYDANSSAAAPLKEAKKPREVLQGGLVSAAPLAMDEKLKRDLKVIQMRNYMDPKRFYKNSDKISKVLHVGTVIEGSAEFKSARISRKDRKTSLLDEVMGDTAIKGYTKRKYGDIQTQHAKSARRPAKRSKTGGSSKGFSKAGGMGRR